MCRFRSDGTGRNRDHDERHRVGQLSQNAGTRTRPAIMPCARSGLLATLQTMRWLDVYDPHTVGERRLDPSSPEAADLRLRRVAESLPVSLESARWVDSAVNNVWQLGDLFLRINFRGDPARLRREAVLLDALPSSIPHVTIVDVGESDGLEWMLSKAERGDNLSAVADELSLDQFRAAIVQLGELLAVLHDWVPPAVVAAALQAKHERLNSGDALDIVATDLVPVPARRVTALIAPLKSLPFVDHGLIDGAADRIGELAQYEREDEYRHVIHGDAGPANVLIDGGNVTTVMDFEFARFAPRDLELISFVRGLDAQRTMTGCAPPVLAWLAEGYPQLFEHVHLEQRLWLFGLAFALETVLFWPPEQPEHGSLHPAHPLRAVRRLIDAPYLEKGEIL
jgi:aminoglycoside phosphotransferase